MFSGNFRCDRCSSIYLIVNQSKRTILKERKNFTVYDVPIFKNLALAVTDI